MQTYLFLILLMTIEIQSNILVVIKNNTLKYWIRKDLQSLKRLSQYRYKTIQTLNNMYQSVISMYNDASIEYYSMSEDDRELLNNIINLII